MPRTARLDVLGVVHHVMARGIDGCTIFRCGSLAGCVVTHQIVDLGDGG